MKIAHISDIHFGKDIPHVTNVLVAQLSDIAPDLIIISGDFTQVASIEEFEAAKEFIDKMPAPTFKVPGNHDISPYNMMERFFSPYEKYKKYIHNDLNLTLKSNNVTIVGLNSSRRAVPHWNWANGAVSQKQRDYMRSNFSATPSDAWKICVLHHPIQKVVDMPLDVTVFGRSKTLALMDELEVDLVLTGHVHHASITTRENQNGYQGVYVSASTAISTRKRSHGNGFNMIELSDEDAKIESLVFNNEDRFEVANTFIQKKNKA